MRFDDPKAEWAREISAEARQLARKIARVYNLERRLDELSELEEPLHFLGIHLLTIASYMEIVNPPGPPARFKVIIEEQPDGESYRPVAQIAREWDGERYQFGPFPPELALLAERIQPCLERGHGQGWVSFRWQLELDERHEDVV